MISIAHLESAVVIITDVLDPYKRKINKESSPVYNEGDSDDENNIEIDRILRKRVTRDKSEYLLHWKN